MQCSGTHAVSRACLIQDLYYDRDTRSFLFHGDNIVSDGDAGKSETTAERFHAAMAFLKGPMHVGDFAVESAGGPVPAAEDVCSISFPVHLRHEYPLGTQSIGHLIRDNFQALVEIPARFGMNATRFSWVMWPRDSGNRALELTHAQEKYSQLISNHPTYKWPHVLRGCDEGSIGAGMDWTNDGDASRVCAHAHFRSLRDLAYSLYDVPHTPVAALPRVLVSFVLKKESDKRRMIVPEGVTEAVQAKWPQVDIEWHIVANEAVATQLGWLSRTSILVSNIGSPSFRMVLLPDGAQVVLVGALETATTGTDGKEHYMGRPFREAEKCWDHLDYLTVHRYHITDGDDVTYGRLRHDPKQARDWEVVRIRDAHVVVRPERFVHAVDAAMARLQEAREDVTDL